jgi:hypothetical protein
MKLSTVLASVNNNPAYYMFIPKQILFWNHFGIKFIAVFVGDKIPDELTAYTDNIILWNNNLELNSAYVAQNLRMYYTALLDLPADEMVMITDMDMLPMSADYYTTGLEHFKIEDFIYYRNVDCNQIYMCYNAAHPKLWGKLFDIHNQEDVKQKIYENYNVHYNGVPGSTGWFIDQQIMYQRLIHYKHLNVLNRPIKRLEMNDYENHLKRKDENFIKNYDDAHFHRNYFKNEVFIMNAEEQLQA